MQYDCAANCAEEPRVAFIGGMPRPIPASANGVDATNPLRQIANARSQGFSTRRLEIGFPADESHCLAIALAMQPREHFFRDIDHAFGPHGSRAQRPAIAVFGPGWIEEPRPPAHEPEVFAELDRTMTGEENVLVRGGFADLIGLRTLGIVQPGCNRWGRVAMCPEVARGTRAAGLGDSPHVLGRAVALRPLARLLATAGGPGLLEIGCGSILFRHVLGTLSELCEGQCGRLSQAGTDPDPVLAIFARDGVWCSWHERRRHAVR